MTPNRIPLFEREGFIICFEPVEPDTSRYTYYRREGKMSQREYLTIRDHMWFDAKITAWRDGWWYGSFYEPYQCWKTYEDFWTHHARFEEFVSEAIEDAKRHLELHPA